MQEFRSERYRRRGGECGLDHRDYQEAADEHILEEEEAWSMGPMGADVGRLAPGPGEGVPSPVLAEEKHHKHPQTMFTISLGVQGYS